MSVLSSEGAAPETMVFASARFGEIEVEGDAILEFPQGLVGIAGTRYTLLTDDPDAVFIWLHSLDDPAFAIPVTNPWRFFPSYEVELSDEETAHVGLSTPDDAAVYVTVRATERLEDFTVNLRAPIVISAGCGHQIINQATNAPVRCALFSTDATSDAAENAA